MSEELNVAFVQDALPFQGGAEKVLAAALQVFPQAPIYTLVYNRVAFKGTIFDDHPVHTSFIDRLPGAHRWHRAYLPLMPIALERLDLSRFDVVITFSYAVAHAAPTHPNQLHLSYIHTPMRYAWRERRPSLLLPYQSLPDLAFKPFRSLFRRWDLAMLPRTGSFFTNSHWMAEWIWRAYRRRAEVLYPPVDTQRFRPALRREEYYLAVSRLVHHKRLDLVVRAFSQLGLPLLVVGTGPEAGRLQALAGPSVRFLGWQPEARVAHLMARARAFVHAGEEDFGIAMAEAQAAGCPVIALESGAAPEIVEAGCSGILFREQSITALRAAIDRFQVAGVEDPPEGIQARAQRFSKGLFQQRLEGLVREKWAAFQSEARIV